MDFAENLEQLDVDVLFCRWSHDWPPIDQVLKEFRHTRQNGRIITSELDITCRRCGTTKHLEFESHGGRPHSTGRSRYTYPSDRVYRIRGAGRGTGRGAEALGLAISRVTKAKWD